MKDPVKRADDAERMRRVKEGDELAFRQIVDMFREPILRLCHQYIGVQEEAEEVAQDVFLHLYRAAATYEPRAKLSTFLYRIAVNLSLNRIRDTKRKRLVSLDMLQTCRPEDPADAESRPDHDLERKEKAEAIRRVIDTLPESQKTALILKRYHGLSYDEIARVMHCSVPSVESRLHRAKQTLTESLKRFLIS